MRMRETCLHCGEKINIPKTHPHWHMFTCPYCRKNNFTKQYEQSDIDKQMGDIDIAEDEVATARQDISGAIAELYELNTILRLAESALETLKYDLNDMKVDLERGN